MNHSHDKPGFERLIATIKTRRQIAEEYHIHPRTLRRKLNDLGVRLPKGNLFPKDQRIVYEALGMPGVE